MSQSSVERFSGRRSVRLGVCLPVVAGLVATITACGRGEQPATPPPPPAAEQPAATAEQPVEYEGSGVLRELSFEPARVEIAHEALSEAGLAAGESEFTLSNPADAAGLQQGQRVSFLFTRSAGDQLTITQITPEP